MKKQSLLALSIATALALPALSGAQVTTPAPKPTVTAKQQVTQKGQILSVDVKKSIVNVRFDNGKTAIIKLSPEVANKIFQTKGRQSLRMDGKLNSINKANRTAMISFSNAAPFEIPLNDGLPPGAELWPHFDWGLSCDGWPPSCEGEISFTWWF